MQDQVTPKFSGEQVNPRFTGDKDNAFLFDGQGNPRIYFIEAIVDVAEWKPLAEEDWAPEPFRILVAPAFFSDPPDCIEELVREALLAFRFNHHLHRDILRGVRWEEATPSSPLHAYSTFTRYALWGDGPESAEIQISEFALCSWPPYEVTLSFREAANEHSDYAVLRYAANPEDSVYWALGEFALGMVESGGASRFSFGHLGSLIGASSQQQHTHFTHEGGTVLDAEAIEYFNSLTSRSSSEPSQKAEEESAQAEAQ